MIKFCKKCKLEKDISNFYTSKIIIDGYRNECKECVRKYQIQNKEHKHKYDQIYYINNQIKILNNKHNYYNEHKNEKQKYNQKYQQDNKKEISQEKKEYLKNNTNARLAHNLRTYLRLILKGNIKSAKTFELIGCTINQLVEHLEKQFKSGMSWKNYGRKENQWSVDHIKPCSLFNLTDFQEQKQCFNYKNLQPLWHIDNIKKSNNYEFISNNK